MAAIFQTAVGTEAPRLLADPAYDVVPFAERYEALGERLGLDFSNILFLLDHLPLAIRGTAHEAQRADVARLIGERKAALSNDLPGMVERHLGALGQPGSHDLLADGILPLVEAVISGLAGIGVAPGSATLVSRVFSQAMGVAQRRALDAELKGLRSQIAEGYSDESDLRKGSRLALVILGRDALVGTIAGSLHAHFQVLDGAPLNAQPFAPVPTHTGVPYIDRVPREGGAPVRCMLQSLEGGTPAERQRFFGAGPHLCLGRPVTLELFQHIAAHLGRLGTRASVEAWRLRKDDVFAFPDRFTVRINP